MDASCIQPFFLILQPARALLVSTKNRDGYSEEHVFHKDFHADQDEDQTAGDLHSVTKEILELFAEHDTGKRDSTTNNPDDERRYQDSRPEYPESDSNGKGIDAGGKGERHLTDIPATQPSTVMPAWNPPKQRAMMNAARESPDFVVLPTARETAKQSIESPIPIRTGVRKSIGARIVGKEIR